jgi:hypothetical protein
MGIKAALDKLNDKVSDLSSLHVQTFSGTLNIEVSEADKFKKLEEALGQAEGNVALSIETLMHFDGDAYNFMADGISPELRDVHRDALEAGMNARKALMDMVSNWIK